MTKAAMSYVKDNAKGQKLSYRKPKEWAEVGTKEEMACLARYQRREAIGSAVNMMYIGALVYVGAKYNEKVRADQKKEIKKLKKQLKEQQ